MHEIYPMVILTFGDEKFQCMKIDGAGISVFFHDIIVTRNAWKDTDANLLSKGELALFVEDNPRIGSCKGTLPAYYDRTYAAGAWQICRYAERERGGLRNYRIT